MNCTNTTLSNEEMIFLKSLIGKKFKSYYCDRFRFNSMAYGIIYFDITNNNFALTNMLEEMNYFKAKENNAVFHFKHNITKRESLLDNIELIKHDVNSKIEKIYIINDTTSLTFDGAKYQYTTTMGIIFEIEKGRQIGFERTVNFSEDIDVQVGYNVIENFVPVEDNIVDQDKNTNPACKRDIIQL